MSDFISRLNNFLSQPEIHTKDYSEIAYLMVEAVREKAGSVDGISAALSQRHPDFVKTYPHLFATGKTLETSTSLFGDGRYFWGDSDQEIDIQALHQEMLDHFHEKLGSADQGEKKLIIPSLSGTLEVNPELLETFVMPLLNSRNYLDQLTALEILAEVKTWKSSQVLNATLHLLTEKDRTLRCAAICALERISVDERELVIEKLRPLLKDSAYEVGIQSRRTLWKLGYHQQAQEFAEYYAALLDRRVIDDLSIEALHALSELPPYIAQTQLGVLSKAIQFVNSYININTPFTDIDELLSMVGVDNEFVSILRRRSNSFDFCAPFYQSLVKLYKELVPKNLPKKIMDRLGLVVFGEQNKIENSKSYFYDAEKVKQELTSWFSWKRMIAVLRILSQPHLQKEGLDPQLISPLLDLIRNPNAWIPYTQNQILICSITALAYARERLDEITKAVLPFIINPDLPFMRNLNPSVQDAAKFVFKNLIPRMNPETLKILLEIATDPQHPLFIYVNEVLKESYSELTDDNRILLLNSWRTFVYPHSLLFAQQFIEPLLKSRDHKPLPTPQTVETYIRFLRLTVEESCITTIFKTLANTEPEILFQADSSYLESAIKIAKERIIRGFGWGEHYQFLFRVGEIDFIKWHTLGGRLSNSYVWSNIITLGAQVKEVLPTLKGHFDKTRESHPINKAISAALILHLTHNIQSDLRNTDSTQPRSHSLSTLSRARNLRFVRARRAQLIHK